MPVLRGRCERQVRRQACPHGIVVFYRTFVLNDVASEVARSRKMRGVSESVCVCAAHAGARLLSVPRAMPGVCGEMRHLRFSGRLSVVKGLGLQDTAEFAPCVIYRYRSFFSVKVPGVAVGVNL